MHALRLRDLISRLSARRFAITRVQRIRVISPESRTRRRGTSPFTPVVSCLPNGCDEPGTRQGNSRTVELSIGQQVDIDLCNEKQNATSTVRENSRRGRNKSRLMRPRFFSADTVQVDRPSLSFVQPLNKR